jgi:hypothetical protein
LRREVEELKRELGRVLQERTNTPDPEPSLGVASLPVWKSKVHGGFALNRRVDLHAIDATPARWRGHAGSSPLNGASTAK